MAAIATNANAPAASGKPTNRRRFLDAGHCRATDRPPVWLMRQAGRALPEYRELKEKHSFLELIQTPGLAAEVTLQPVRRFGFDAAILFSDILVIPEAMGQPYRFRETGGVVMDFAVRTKADIERLSVERVTERLSYVDQALRLLRKELGDQTALIGFSGSPWTLATFMMEGGSAGKYTRALSLFRDGPGNLLRARRETHCRHHRLSANANQRRRGRAPDFRQSRRPARTDGISGSFRTLDAGHYRQHWSAGLRHGPA